MPRLRPIQAKRLSDALTGKNDAATVRFRLADLTADGVWFSDAAGQRMTQDELQTLRKGLEDIARKCGFPSQSTVSGRAEFDNACIVYFGEHIKPSLSVAEGLDDEVWIWFTLCLGPDLTVWRFPEPNIKRRLGGNRNMFGRLWTRCSVFDRGPDHADRWGLARALTEDAIVSICERTSVLRDKTLCLAIGEAWVRASRTSKGDILQEKTRSVMKAITAKNEVICLTSMPDDELSRMIDAMFKVAS